MANILFYIATILALLLIVKCGKYINYIFNLFFAILLQLNEKLNNTLFCFQIDHVMYEILV